MRRFERALRVERGERLLVAVSGGADSVALLHALHRVAPERGISLVVGHVHHGLRGREADRDARFVRGLAESLGLPHEERSIDARAISLRRGRGPEEGARWGRYRALAEAARARRAGLVAVAHTADDQAETVLLRILRGTGRRGLGGMASRSRIAGEAVVRPLLGFTKGEILAFLRALGARWMEDSSNESPRYARNRVRRRILPLLEREVPGVGRRLSEAAEGWRAEERYLDRRGAKALERLLLPGGGIPIEPLRRLPSPLRTRVLRAAAGRSGAPRMSRRATRLLERLATEPALRGPVRVGRGVEAVKSKGGTLEFVGSGRVAAPRRGTSPRPGDSGPRAKERRGRG